MLDGRARGFVKDKMFTNSVSLYLWSVLIWGSTWFAIKFQLGVVAAEVSLVYRFGLAAILLLLFCVLKRRSLKFCARQHGFIALSRGRTRA